MPKQTIVVKSNDENPEPIELIAESIIQISEAFNKINNSRLNKRVIVLLLNDAIPSRYKIGIPAINAVLEYAPKLKDYYIKAVPKPLPAKK